MRLKLKVRTAWSAAQWRTWRLEKVAKRKGMNIRRRSTASVQKNQPSQARRICEPLEGDDDFDKLLGSGSEKDLGVAKQIASKGKTQPGRRSGDGDCFEEAGNDLRQVNPIAR